MEDGNYVDVGPTGDDEADALDSAVAETGDTERHIPAGFKPEIFVVLEQLAQELSPGLADIAQAVTSWQARELEVTRGRITANQQADGAGACTLSFDGPDEGEFWLVERVMLTGLAAASIAAFLGETADANSLLDAYAAIPASTRLAVGYSPEMFIAENRRFSFIGTGLGAAGTLSVAMQIKRVKLER